MPNVLIQDKKGLLLLLSLFFNRSCLHRRAALHWARERRHILSSCLVAVWRWHDWHKCRRTNREATYSLWTTIKWEGHHGCPSYWVLRVGQFPCRHNNHKHIFPLRTSHIQNSSFFQNELFSLLIWDDRARGQFALNLNRSVSIKVLPWKWEKKRLK